MRNIIFLILSVLLAFGCNNNTDEQKKVSQKVNNKKIGMLTGSVVEKLDVDKYTYVKIKNTNNKEIWIAGPKDDTVKVGSKLDLASGMVMKDFVSKTLNRTFKEIYFVGSLTSKKSVNFHGTDDKSKVGSFHGKTKAKSDSHNANKNIRPKLGKEYEVKKVEKVEGGHTIEEIFQNKKELNGKVVKVRGVVVKFASEIMNRNWVHIKDGSGKSEDNDLTITTKELVKVGDIVTFEGKLAVNKDFGYGYKYSVIIEESTKK